jgi:hypothetical protein
VGWHGACVYTRKKALHDEYEVDFYMYYANRDQNEASEKVTTKRNFRRNYGKGLIVFLFSLLSWTTNSSAGQITLAWDPNESDGTNLIGYNLYYKAGASAAVDPYGANLVYIPLTDPDFDPDNPNYQVTGLSDSETYYFVVTAMYNDDESGMSNEVSAIAGSGSGQHSSINAATNGSSAGSSSGGCFIDSLK